MVCDRCITAVASRLVANGLGYKSLTLGEVELTAPPVAEQLLAFKLDVDKLGFELLEDKTARQISQIKSAVLAWVGMNDSKPVKFSHYLTEILHKDYASLSNLFSSVEGRTIEQFIIHQKIERVKELLVYDEQSLGEIASQLGYSSVQHLSGQFKKVTGMTPTYFKKSLTRERIPLDKI